MILVEGVKSGSIAEELGLEPGSRLLTVNNRDLDDFLDWEYLTSDECFTLVVRTPDDELVEYDVERPEGMPIGVVLAAPKVITCSNRCEFCFVKGNPKGLRGALYVRDDDYRLSFRYGNFVTLTNLRQRDIERICEYRLSPLYVSVHSSDPEMRRRLLGNPNAPDVLGQMKALGARGIEFHTQIVLQPGVNDGAALDRTLADLYELGETVISVSVVPVGLTCCNLNASVRRLSAEECREAISSVDSVAERALAERCSHWVYGSDELYIDAGVSLPSLERYDELAQLENGVGVVRYFQQRLRDTDPDIPHAKIGITTGRAMEPLFPEVLGDLEARTGTLIELIVLENEMFGPTVTTAGLLPGSAFVSVAKERDDLDLVLVPAEALNDDMLFIDNVSLGDLQRVAATEIRASRWIADAFTETMR